jgi:1,4-alpha-glucan branching enzyme
VYGKGSLINKMPGDAWQQFANLRALFGYMWAHPGKKLLFMGCEFAQRREWTHEGQLEWFLTENPDQPEQAEHRGMQHLVGELNRVLRGEPALHQLDFAPEGFQWLEADDSDQSVYAFLRRASDGGTVLVVSNLTPLPRQNYFIGVPTGGLWQEILNSDARAFGGSGWGNLGAVEASPMRSHGQRHSLCLTLPPLSTLYLKVVADGSE